MDVIIEESKKRTPRGGSGTVYCVDKATACSDPSNWGGASGNTTKHLLLQNAVSTTDASRVPFSNVLAQSLTATIGDLFNQSSYFRRNGVGLTTSQLFINNTPLMPQPLEPELV